jgi:galactonate dehydratase
MLALGAGLLAAPAIGCRETEPSLPALRLKDVELIPLRATERTVWLFVRLETDTGLTGLGEASDAFGFANTTEADTETMRAELVRFFALLEGRSPFDVEAFRQEGALMAAEGLVAATASSAIEQAMWDLAGKALAVPSYTFFGGKVRDLLPVYANINRATNPRTPEGFAQAAMRAVGGGFQAIKAAPFDGFPTLDGPADAIEEATRQGIAAVAAMREAVGGAVDIMIDCHSFFDVDLAERVARELDPLDLTWYEEPVAPDNIADTIEIGKRISQPLAGGELLHGMAGFMPLIEAGAFDVIMPDVKHCGGLLELTRIAAAADNAGIRVAPHNPSGPVSTAASVQICAGMRNFSFLELQYGEVDWRADVLVPPETFVDGQIAVPEAPGFGVDLDDYVIAERGLTL